MYRKNKVFISGFPRAGTTMMLLMLQYFDLPDKAGVYVEGEMHPIYFIETFKLKRKYLVVKQPFGCFEDFPPQYDYNLLVSKYNYKIISMVRDPRDVLVSRHQRNLNIYWVKPEIVIRNCEEYIKNINNPRVLFIRYEDLVTSPDKEIKKVSAFIGFPYNENFVNFYTLKAALLPVNNSLNTPRAIDNNSIGNWKKEEHEDRIKEVMTDKLEEYIVKLGYQL